MKAGSTFARLILVSALMLLIAACGGPDPSLTGVVTDRYSGKPIANASVSIDGETTQTGQDGRYRFATWSPEGQLKATLDGYEEAAVDLKSKPELASAQPEATLNLDLRPNTVGGVVTDLYSGQPLAGVMVKASETLSATTGADGRYLIKGVPEQFKLTAELADHDAASADVTRQLSQDLALRPNTVTGQVVDKYSGKPISGATVSAGGVTATTDAEGKYTLRGVAANSPLQVVATDYASETVEMPDKATSLDATLRPNVVQGTIMDATSSKPISDAVVLAMPAPTTVVSPTQPYTGTAISMVRSDAEGHYKLEGISDGVQIQVLMPGYKKAVTPFSEGAFQSDIKLEPFKLKSIYIGAMASSKDLMMNIFDMIEQTELNAIVFDVKLELTVEEAGLVGYISNLPLVQELDTHADYLDLKWLAEECHKRGIYVIARMPIMRDNVLATTKTEWAVQRRGGGIWEDHGGLHWLDPFRTEVHDYNIALAKEIADYGIDEIQFDYIRFPSDGDVDEMVFSVPIKRGENEKEDQQKMYNTIGGLLKRAHETVNGSGAFLSIDVFGYATWRNMWEIGQSLEVMAPQVDYIYPMVYPSHYDRNELGLGNADAHPYEIVKHSLDLGGPRIEGRRALFRPFLQAFTATWLYAGDPVRYDRSMIQAQIKAADDFGANGWAMWNAAGDYDPGWFDAE